MTREVSKKITGEIGVSPETVAEIKKEVKDINSFAERIKASSEIGVTETMESMLSGAFILDASDIHIEPKEEDAKVRIRIDGVLQDVLLMEKKPYESLLSRIKLISGIKLNISGQPQDGRFSILIDGSLIEIRTSTLPSEYGESIVLRILNPKSLYDLESLGLRNDLLETFRKEIKKPNGMIIVTGPTGAGKTTTLYAFLKKIQSSEIKIITIEDPIEYHLKGVSQTQIAPEKGYDFASGLKSIMRQDPDAILVGEIRDLETAEIALQASLTGHLVLTTLHTNDAAGTVPRLISLGARPENIAPAINMAVAQRLVRIVCKKCVKMEKPSSQILNRIKADLKDLPKNIKMPEINDNLKIPKAAGCKHCNSTGYKGRVGIYEAFLVNDEMEKFILTSPPTSSLKERAVKEGMITMYRDGLIKVLEGLTTFEELEKITGGE